MVNRAWKDRHVGPYLKQLGNLLATLYKRGVDVSFNSQGGRDDSIEPSSNHKGLMFSIFDNEHRAAVLGDPLDNASPECHE